jgi:hypothetical protein
LQYASKEEQPDFRKLTGAVAQALARNPEIEDPTLAQCMRAVCNQLLKATEFSAQEAAHLLLSHDLVGSSRAVVRLDTRKPDRRPNKLKPASVLAGMEPEDADILEEGEKATWLKMYAARPTNAANADHDWDAMHLAHFVSTFRVAAQRGASVSGAGEGAEDEEAGGSDNPLHRARARGRPREGEYVLQMTDRSTCRIAPRTAKHKVVVSTQPYTPTNDNSEDSCYSRLLLYVPWRSEHELLAGFGSAVASWEARKQTLPDALKDALHVRDAVEEAISEVPNPLPHTNHWGEDGDWQSVLPGLLPEVAGLPPQPHNGPVVADMTSHAPGTYEHGTIVLSDDDLAVLLAKAKATCDAAEEAEQQAKAALRAARTPGTAAWTQAWDEHRAALTQIADNPEQKMAYDLAAVHLMQNRQLVMQITGGAGRLPDNACDRAV